MSSRRHQDDLTADLLADLAPKDDPTPPPVPEEPAPLPPELNEVTPAVSVHWTPLRWSRPKVVRSTDGAGKALRLGPLQVELTVKE
jgi:hypothetical protein